MDDYGLQIEYSFLEYFLQVQVSMLIDLLIYHINHINLLLGTFIYSVKKYYQVWFKEELL